MKLSTVRVLSWMVLTTVWTTSCVEQECSSITDPVLTISFAEFTNAAKTSEQNITVEFDNIYGLGKSPVDSLLRTKAAIGSIRLPLSQVSDMTAFVFVRNGTTDTLTLSYSRQPFFISQACGFEMRYNDLSIVSDTFDDPAVVLESAVTAAANETHVKIYY